MNQTKICTTCKIEKDLTEFSLAKLGKLGRAAKCKDCKKQFYQDNIEKITATNIAYKETHRSELNKKQKDYAESEKGRQARAAYRAKNKKEVEPITKKTKEEIAVYQKEYNQKNKEALRQQKKEYRKANLEIIQERKRKYRKANREKIISKDRQYYADNKTQLLEKCKIYRQENKEKKSAQDKQYRQTPNGKAAKKAGEHNYRALKRNAPGKHTAKDILNLFNQQSGTCPYCKCELNKTGNNKYHVDHVMPLSKGGSNGPENLQLLCPTCNLSKSAKLPEEFAAELGLLL